MVDTTTTVLALVKQTPGGNRNTWGGILNNNFDLIEEAFCGRHSISTTGGTTTLTQAQARKRFIDVTGTLISDATIVVPNGSKDWFISNATAGDFAVLVKTSGSAATSVPQGTGKEIQCTGNDGVFRTDYHEVGQMSFFGNTSAPAGWSECDGLTLSRAGNGIDLFAKISTTWGVGNGSTTFTKPDAKTAGKFLRSRSGSVTISTSQSDQNKAHTHSGSTVSTSLSLTATTSDPGNHAHGGNTGGVSANHTHDGTTAQSKNINASGITVGGGTLWAGATINSATGIESSNHTHAFTTNTDAGAHTHTLNFAGSSASSTPTIASDGGTEARPTNLSAILCIKL